MPDFGDAARGGVRRGLGAQQRFAQRLEPVTGHGLAGLAHVAPALPGRRQPEAAMIVRLVVHQADHADQRLGRGLLADRPRHCWPRAMAAGPGSVSTWRRAVGRIGQESGRPGSAPLPIAETGAGWRRRLRAPAGAGSGGGVQDAAGLGRTWDGRAWRRARRNGGNATARDSRREKARPGNVYHDGLSDASARPSRHWRKTVNTPTKTSAWRFSATSRTWRWACAIPATRSSTSGRCWNACCSGQHRGQEGLLRLGALQGIQGPMHEANFELIEIPTCASPARTPPTSAWWWTRWTLAIPSPTSIPS